MFFSYTYFILQALHISMIFLPGLEKYATKKKGLCVVFANFTGHLKGRCECQVLYCIVLYCIVYSYV